MNGRCRGVLRMGGATRCVSRVQSAVWRVAWAAPSWAWGRTSDGEHLPLLNWRSVDVVGSVTNASFQRCTRHSMSSDPCEATTMRRERQRGVENKIRARARAEAGGVKIAIGPACGPAAPPPRTRGAGSKPRIQNTALLR